MCTTAAVLYPKASCQNLSQATAAAAMLCSCKRTIAYQFKPALVWALKQNMARAGAAWLR